MTQKKKRKQKKGKRSEKVTFSEKEKEVIPLVMDIFESGLIDTENLANALMEIYRSPFLRSAKETFEHLGAATLLETKIRVMTEKDEFLTPIGVMSFTANPEELWDDMVGMVLKDAFDKDDAQMIIADFLNHHIFIVGFLTLFVKMIDAKMLRCATEKKGDISKRLWEATSVYTLTFLEKVTNRLADFDEG